MRLRSLTLGSRSFRVRFRVCQSACCCTMQLLLSLSISMPLTLSHHSPRYLTLFLLSSLCLSLHLYISHALSACFSLSLSPSLSLPPSLRLLPSLPLPACRPTCLQRQAKNPYTPSNILHIPSTILRTPSNIQRTHLIFYVPHLIFYISPQNFPKYSVYPSRSSQRRGVLLHKSPRPAARAVLIGCPLRLLHYR